MNKETANKVIDALQAEGIDNAGKQLRLLNILDSLFITPEIDPDDISDISEAEYPKDYERVKGHNYDVNLQARTAYMEGIKKGIELIKGKL